MSLYLRFYEADIIYLTLNHINIIWLQNKWNVTIFLMFFLSNSGGFFFLKKWLATHSKFGVSFDPKLLPDTGHPGRDWGSSWMHGFPSCFLLSQFVGFIWDTKVEQGTGPQVPVQFPHWNVVISGTSLFVSVHVYMCVYVCLHMCMYVDVHPQGCRGLVITLDIFYFRIYSRPRNKRGTPWFLLIQLALRISCLCLLSIRITGDCHACPDVTWLLEIQTWSLILSHLPRPGQNL